MDIRNWLSIGLVKVFAGSLMVSMLEVLVVNSANAESLEQKQGDFLEILVIGFWILILAVCTLPVFLNVMEAFRSKPIFRLLSFYLLPLVVTFIFWYFNASRNGATTFWLATFTYFLALAFLHFHFVRSYVKQP
jgi:hypothetical protein